LADRLVPASPHAFLAEVDRLAAALAGAADLRQRIAAKEAARLRDEAKRPLGEYRRDELARMRRIFFDPDAPYHALRSAFVRKVPSGSARPLSRPSPFAGLSAP
jgi:putative two-component system hydrogenase maturation factor HypX/HoxX